MLAITSWTDFKKVKPAGDPGYIENRTFDEIKVGDSASLTRTLTKRDIELFAVMSGDINPAHMDEEFAKSDMFHKVIAHGMWGGALISTVLGTQLPGPGTIYLGQSLRRAAYKPCLRYGCAQLPAPVVPHGCGDQC
jgi:acyl dehydratase